MKANQPPLALARKLPAPTAGAQIKAPSLEVLHEYLELHGLEIVRFYGGQVVVRKVRAQVNTMRETAEYLSKA